MRSHEHRPVLHPSVAAALALLAACGSAAAADAAACAALTGVSLPGVTLASAEVVAATSARPEHCRVVGRVDTEINFNLLLPTEWNGKFIFGGEGGLAGQLSDQTVLQAGGRGGLQRGYALAYSDTGHVGKVLPGATSPVYDGSWAWQNPERQVNWAHRSTHVVADAAKGLLAAYYGRPAAYSYFSGCSGGGRQAVMTAQRYPNDFDGIIAGAPWLNVTGQVMAWNNVVRTLTRVPIPPAKLALVAGAARSACDGLDGVVDGLVSAPHACPFDPQTLACQGGDAANCLTAGEVGSVQAIYDGAQTSRGRTLFPGYEPGAEDSQWPNALVHTTNGGPGQLLVFLPDQVLRYFVFGPDYDTLTFDIDRDRFALRPTGDLVNVKPDLSAFRAAGGKLLVYHGWADPRLAPWYSIEYRQDVMRTVGVGPGGLDDFFKLYMVPGMGHCSGGPGPNAFDALTALEQWVEQGRPPGRIVATHSTGGVVDRSRPLCPYPQVAVWDGKGSSDAAGSFVCRRPALAE